MAIAEKASVEESSYNSDLNQFSYYLHNAVGYVKQAYSLDPWESFTVEGEYSTSWFWLYKWRVILGFTLVSGLILLAAFVIKRLIKNKKNQQIPGVIIGVINSLIACGVIFLGTYLLNNLPRFLSYQTREIVMIFLAFALVIFLMGLLFGIPILISLKRNDWKVGLIVFGTTLFLLVIEGMFLLLILQAFF